MMKSIITIIGAGVVFSFFTSGCGQSSPPASVTGEQKLWHKITLSWQGPESAETATPNPFTDYRLDVLFTHTASGTSYLIPGYYAADGDAANTGAEAGNVWRAHFSPCQVGEWTYRATFRSGQDVAVNTDVEAGEATAFDGSTGSFTVAESDKTGRDMRAKGRLEYVGGHYLQFAGDKTFFLKQGADAPENFLSYQDFDGDFKSDGHKDDLVKTWEPHVRDWKEGDPIWGDGRGKGIIGAVNYLASEGLNAVSFLTMNIGGDDRNVFPYTGYDERLRMDVSKLDQWEMVLEHAAQQGLFLHFKTQESENEMLLDNGDTGPQRILYYRELVARFGHHPALNWNLGEENGKWGKENYKNDFQSTPQRQAMAQWFHDNDPYTHHIVIHNGQNEDDLLGSDSKLTGWSLQTWSEDFKGVPWRTAALIRKSAKAGRPWAVACDEPGDASYAIRPDDDAANSHEDGRRNALWGCLMNQGFGSEYYFGYKAAHSDLTCNDYRSRDKWWDYCRYALEFFDQNDVAVWELKPAHKKLSDENSWCLAESGKCYLIYLKNGGEVTLDLSGVEGDFKVQWYNPRTGGELQSGSAATITGGEVVSVGTAPAEADQDWLLWVTRS
ncbi:MAG: DUF5060 domain-containing protein [Verrucomicrobiota bacterium]